tara:strand:+ start:211 stop:675 length:465 start_codon:yes stop_codon:yes gene_type:complete
MEVTIDVSNPFVTKMAKLLQQKDKLVGKDAGDGRNQYQIEVQKLKDQIKSFNKEHNLKGKKAHKFGNVLKMTKAAESRGTFDRGAEGKAKNKLRKKMASKAEKSFTAGRHKGSDIDKEIEKGMKGATSEEEVRVAQRLTGTKEKKKKESIAKSR